ncbi:major facilitator superfamily domain-containing protein [Immersiella caudata]|uniref:Major facilitator superfamily domain-containing protein n=1 Tax=Immersiella caudata TaxID=314043 RepID=A0AA39WAF3_9PEZI|nr:major facilitator superfamily domain-containing protein [Immersiella caudata]
MDSDEIQNGRALPLGTPLGETETSPERRQEKMEPDAEIEYLYLTFKTPLPVPNITNSNSSGASVSKDGALPSPDLTPYANPLGWPNSRKNMVLFLSCMATFLTAYTSGSYSPPQDLIREDLGASSNVTVLVGITTFCVGFALAPMFLAPFSEMNGRYPVFVVSGIVYVIFQAVCGVVRNLAGMLIARLFVGIGASVFSTMVGGVIADMWGKEGRNTPMALFSGAVMIGTGAGPLFAAIMTRRLGHIGTGNAAAWKWVFWHQVIMGSLLMLALAVLLKESRGSVLLSRKAKALNKWYEELENQGHYGVWVNESKPTGSSDSSGTEGSSDEEKGKMHSVPPTVSPDASLKRVRWIVKEDEERSSLGKMVTVSVSRPFHLLFSESIVFFFSVWVSFAWGVLYLSFGSIPLVFKRQYGWDIEQSGYAFVSLAIGGIIGTILSIWLERILHHPKWAVPGDSPSASSLTLVGEELSNSDEEARSGGQAAPSSRSDKIWAFIRRRFPADAPEARIYFACVTSILLPAGLFIFGLTARPHIHWIFSCIGLALATMGILSIYLAIFNYFADSYNQYASSALAAQSMCRNLVGGAFPLVTAALFTNLGETRATCLLGAIAIGLTVVPWVLVFYGERIRARSPFASQLGQR